MQSSPPPVHAQLLPWAGDLASALAIVSTMFKMLPEWVALVALVWYGIQIYESRPVQTFLRLHRHRKRRRKLGRDPKGARVVHHPRHRYRRKTEEPAGV